MDLGTLWGAIGLDDSKFTDGIRGALSSLTNFSSKGVTIAATAGAGIALALAGSIVAGISLEPAADKMNAQLGLVGKDAERAGAVAGALYADAYGESMADVNNAVAAVMSSIGGMREASSADLQAITAKAMDFAAAFEIDVARAAQVAGQAVSTGLAKDATEAFDLIVAASQRVPANLREDLLDAADEYGPFFAQLGMKGEQAFALLVDASAKGMYGIDKAGDALKEFTIRATDMSTASQDAYEALGMDAEAMSNKILAGGDTANQAFDQIVDGLLGIKDPATRANTAIALFGTPIEDLSTGEIPKFLKSLKSGSKAMDDFGGAADRMGATLNDNASTALTEIKRRLEGAFVKLGDKALPTINEFTAAIGNGLGPALESLGAAAGKAGSAVDGAFAFFSDHDTLAKALAITLGIALLPALVAVGVNAVRAGTQMVVGWTMARVASVTSMAWQLAGLTLIGLGWMQVGAKAVAGAAVQAGAWLLAKLSGLSTIIWYGIAFALMAAGWIATGVAAMAGAVAVAAAWLVAIWPIALVIAAIALVVFLVIKYWDEIKSATVAAWDWVVALLGSTWEWIKNAARAAWAFLLTITVGVWLQVGSAIANGVSSAVGFVSSLPGKIKAVLSGAGSWLVGVGKDAMRGLRDGIEAGFAWVRSKLSGLGHLIPGWLKKVLGISSPSRVMRDQIGKWIPAGVADGIEVGNPILEAAVAAMGAGVVVPITAAPSYRAAAAAGYAVESMTSRQATGTDGPASGYGAADLLNALSQATVVVEHGPDDRTLATWHLRAQNAADHFGGNH